MGNQPPSVPCPAGHPLRSFKTDSDGYLCNSCKNAFVAGTVLHGCRQCDYDVCYDCLGKIQGDWTYIGKFSHPEFGASPIEIVVKMPDLTWAALGQTASIVVERNGKAITIREVDGPTAMEGNFDEQGTISGIVIQDGVRGGSFSLKKESSIGKRLVVKPISDQGVEELKCTQPMFKDDELISIHRDGEVVEYFSSTHKVWLLGVVQVKLKDNADEGDLVADPYFVYNVRLRQSSQWRYKVPLDMMRKPFEPMDIVDVFSKRKGGSWMVSVIESSAGYMMKEYKCRVFGEGAVPPMTLEKVPSWRIRRRFPPGCSVEVYRGSLEGWQAGVVHSVAAEFPAEPPVPLSALSPGSGGSRTSEPAVATDIPRSMTMLMEDATICATSVVGDDGAGVYPWVQIPVYHEEWDEQELEEDFGKDPDMELGMWTPSYLIRLRAVHWKSEENDRRSFAL